MSPVPEPVPAGDPASLYLDLLKKVLLNETGLEAELRIAYLHDCARSGTPPDRIVLRDIRLRQADRFAALARRRRDGQVSGDDIGLDCAFTMSGRHRLDHLEHCLTQVLRDGIAGDFLEAGVWRGGCGLFARGVFKAHGVADRRIWLADSFAGVPPPSHPADAGVALSDRPELAIQRVLVEEAFRRFGLWGDDVILVEGLFADTLPALPVDALAVLRLDGDLFTSTLDTLSALYGKVTPGGYIIVDDYGALPGCRFAIEAFRLAKGIQAPLETVDWTCVAWRKPLAV